MTQPVRTIWIAGSLVLFSAGIASAQRGGGGLPRIVSAPAPVPAAAGRMGVPAYATPAAGPTAPRAGNLPRLPGRAAGYRSGTRQSAYTRWGASSSCFGGCFTGGVGGFHKHFLGSFIVGYPFWGAVVWPYFDYGYGSTYTEPAAESYEPPRAASKLIVVGGGSTTGGGDALTIEALGDSVRLSWLGANRPVRGEAVRCRLDAPRIGDAKREPHGPDGHVRGGHVVGPGRVRRRRRDVRGRRDDDDHRPIPAALGVPRGESGCRSRPFATDSARRNSS